MSVTKRRLECLSGIQAVGSRLRFVLVLVLVLVPPPADLTICAVIELRSAVGQRARTPEAGPIIWHGRHVAFPHDRWAETNDLISA